MSKQLVDRNLEKTIFIGDEDWPGCRCWEICVNVKSAYIETVKAQYGGACLHAVDSGPGLLSGDFLYWTLMGFYLKCKKKCHNINILDYFL